VYWCGARCSRGTLPSHGSANDLILSPCPLPICPSRIGEDQVGRIFRQWWVVWSFSGVIRPVCSQDLSVLQWPGLVQEKRKTWEAARGASHLRRKCSARFPLCWQSMHARWVICRQLLHVGMAGWASHMEVEHWIGGAPMIRLRSAAGEFLNPEQAVLACA